jgi:hypothetical protein
MAAMAECSQCEDTFPLASPKRTYVLSPSGPVTATATTPVQAPAGGVDPDVASTGQAQEWWRSDPFEIALALAPSALGGVRGYYLAGQQNQDPVTWSAMGGAGGLLVGWLGLLWMQRKR